MKIKMLLITVVLAGLLFSLSASAQTSCPAPITTGPDCVSVPIGVTGQNFQRDLPKFDTSLGELISVKLTGEACGTTRLSLDSEDPNNQTWFITTRGGIILVLPTGKELFTSFGTPQGAEDEIVTAVDNEADDGEADFIGTDFGVVEYPNICDDREFVFDTEADMALFKGNAGETLPVTIKTNSSSTVRNPGSTNYASRSFARAGGEVCVEYTYCKKPDFFCINGTKTNACTDLGLPGWTIQLKDASGAVIATTTTNADGEYSFCDLLAGSYTVCEVMQAGWKNVGDTCIPVPLVDENAEDVNFVNEPPFCISGHKFNNATGEGLGGWKINLKDASGAPIATTTTATDGSYQFCGLFSGSYTVCEVMQANWKSVGDICKPVTLNCADETGIDFRNQPVTTGGCAAGCPWYIRSELYRAKCGVPLEVLADHGVLANDRVGATVINAGSIKIEPKYGTLSVADDGSFVFNPAPGISGTVTFKYGANDGVCDASGQGTAKIQVSCTRTR